jgi:hypothetical protein
MSAFFSSLSLFNLSALIALTSIIIPVLIHIINPSRGRIVLIGRIAFVKQSQKLKVSELKLTQWLLLLLRLSLLILLSLLLAGLYKENKPIAFDNSHVYLSSDWLTNASQAELKTLIKVHAADDLFLLDERFRKISSSNRHSLAQLTSLKDELSVSKRSKIINGGLINELDNKNHQPETTFLYVTNKLINYSAERARFSKSYQWRVKNISVEANVEPIIEIDLFYDNSRILDKSYLAVALDFLKPNNQNLAVRYYPLSDKLVNQVAEADVDTNTGFNESTKVASHRRWIFWLADTDVPVEIMNKVRRGGYLLTDATLTLKKDVVTSSRVVIENELMRFSHKQPALAGNLEKNEIWGGNTGLPILSFVQVGKGKIYEFSSRFHHDWTNLVESSRFPRILNKLLRQDWSDSALMPVSSSEIEGAKLNSINNNFNKQPLYPWLIFLVCVLWLLERWLAERSSPNNGAVVDE